MKHIAEKIINRSRKELIKEFLYLFPANRPRKILFDHLPKCGGSSLNVYLSLHYPRKKTFSIDGWAPAESIDKFKNLSQNKRHGYDLVKGHFAHELLDYVHPDCFKVTVLREPVDRIISHYFYAKRTPGHYLYPKIVERGMSLEEYATSGLSGELRNWYTTHFSGLALSDAEKYPEESVTKAIEVLLARYDIIGLLNNFASFVETLQRKAKLRYEYKDGKDNVTKDRLSLYDVSPSTLEKIEKINHLDIAFYKRIISLIG